MSHALWIVIDIVVGIVLGLVAGVPIGLVLGYDWANAFVARPLINVPVNEAEKERKVEYGAASTTKRTL